eukprot:SAG31_NODE_14179_length_823_cov_1.266575_2_plen_127_part_00
MDAPVLFYYEDHESGGKPKGTISLANIKCRVPKSKRKDFEHAFRVDVMGAAEGHNKYIFAPETEEEIIRALLDCRSSVSSPTPVPFGDISVCLVCPCNCLVPQSPCLNRFVVQRSVDGGNGRSFTQ